MSKKRAKEDWIKATIDFIEEFGYKKLTSRVKYNGLSIGIFRQTQRRKFKKLETQEERVIMINEFKKLPLEYLGNNAVLFAKQQGLNVVDGYYKG